MWKRRNFDQIEEITFFKSELKQGPKGYLKVKCCQRDFRKRKSGNQQTDKQCTLRCMPEMLKKNERKIPPY